MNLGCKTSLILLCLLSLLWGCRLSGKSEKAKVEPVEKTAYEDIVSHVVDPALGRLAFYSKDDQQEYFANHGRLKEWLSTQDKKLLFAVNGGMYQEDLKPLGLYIENGKEIKRLNAVKEAYGNFYLQPNGIFYLTHDNEAFVVLTDSITLNKEIKYATQSGPMLLIGGEMHPAINKDSPNLHIRNGVGILSDGKVLFAISKKRVNFYRLASFFKDQGCKNALYLDGFVSRMYLPSKDWVQEGGKFGIIIAEVD